MSFQQNQQLLCELKLMGALSCYRLNHADPAFLALSFDESFGLMLDAQVSEAERKRRERLIRSAGLKQPQACVEDIDYITSRGLNRSVMASLHTTQWVDEEKNIFLIGSTGLGKSYIACALANQCIRQGKSVLYKRFTRLLEELEVARADGSIAKLRKRLQRFKVLILDDWGIAPITSQGRHDLLEIIEDRSGIGIIITSQLPMEKWHDWLSEPTIADAILDRIIHRAHVINLKGDSMRKRQSLSKEGEV